MKYTIPDYEEYKDIVEKMEVDELLRTIICPDIGNDKLLAAIYHNRGIAYASNFELEDAMESYRKSYEITGSRQTMYQYLLLMATVKERSDVEVMAKYYQVEDLVPQIYDAIEDAQEDVTGSPIYHRMERAMYHFQKNNLTDFSQRMDTVLEHLKEEFRQQTV